MHFPSHIVRSDLALYLVRQQYHSSLYVSGDNRRIFTRYKSGPHSAQEYSYWNALLFILHTIQKRSPCFKSLAKIYLNTTTITEPTVDEIVTA